jgi:hypothetical protein
MDQRPLALALIATALLLVPVAAAAQDQSPPPSPAPESLPVAEATPVAAASVAPIDDERLAELEALVPPALAGLPLGDNLVLATGEELATVMSDEEAAILGSMLETNASTMADYAAATTFLELAGDDVVVIQAHRVAGVPATETMDTWIEILTRDLSEPEVVEGFIGGRPVTLVSDAAAPERPLLHLYPDGEVTWMMVAADEGLVDSFLDSLHGSEAG